MVDETTGGRKPASLEVVAGRLKSLWQALTVDGIKILTVTPTVTVETESKLPATALQIWKFGHNAAVGTAYETLWTTGGLYPWASWTAWDDATGSTASLASTNAADTSVVVAWEGLGVNGSLVSGTTTTNASDGTTPVNIATKLNRLHRAYRKTAGTTTGDLQISVGGTVVVDIDKDINSSELTLYTVPLAHTAYLQSFVASVDKNADGFVQLMVRPAGDGFKSFTGALTVTGTTTLDYTSNGWSSAPPLAAGTDIDVRGVKLSGGGSPLMSGNFHLVLIPD